MCSGGSPRSFRRQMGQCGAGHDPDGDSRHRGPQHIDQHPAQAEFAELVQPEQSHPQHHKRKSAAVVHARLAGQGEAQLVAVTGMTDLDIGRQHRIGGRQDRAQQDARAQWQAEQIIGEGGDQPDADRHGYRCQQNRRAPAGEAERHGHFDAGGKQRNQHRHFGQHFQQRRFLERIEVKQIEHRRPDQQPHRQIDNGGRDRQALEHRSRQAPGEQQAAHEQKPLCVSHGSFGSLSFQFDVTVLVVFLGSEFARRDSTIRRTPRRRSLEYSFIVVDQRPTRSA